MGTIALAFDWKVDKTVCKPIARIAFEAGVVGGSAAMFDSSFARDKFPTEMKMVSGSGTIVGGAVAAVTQVIGRVFIGTIASIMKLRKKNYPMPSTELIRGAMRKECEARAAAQQTQNNDVID